jgi:hypothetical protein
MHAGDGAHPAPHFARGTLSKDTTPRNTPAVQRTHFALEALTLSLAFGAVPPLVHAQSPTAPPEAAEKPWLKLSGEHRSRYETLNGQFRTRSGQQFADTEDQYMMRTVLRADMDFDPFAATLEVIDARAYGIDENSFTDTTIVDTFDVLQANASYDLGTIAGGAHEILLGRETIDLGSRRLVARNAYRNTINSFTGIDYRWRGGDGRELQVFWNLPVRRYPDDFASLRDNEQDWDDQDLDVQFYGAHWTQPMDQGYVAEAYVLGLHERGSGTRQRDLLTHGVRLVRPATRGKFSPEFEAAYQFGDSRTNATASAVDLSHSAWFVHASLGYTWDAEMQPAVRVAYDFASGDKDPTDRDNGRFDTLYGARRFEYGPTGLWGSIARANIRSPELRFSMRPAKDWLFIIALRDVRLDARRDAWTAAGVHDATGAAGDEVGQQVEARLQWDAIKRRLRIEIGGAYLFEGDFQDDAPTGRGGDSRYGYVEATVWF